MQKVKKLVKKRNIHPVCLVLSPYIYHTHTHSLSLSSSLSHTHNTHTHITHTLSLTHSLSLTHIRTHSLSISLSHSFSLSGTLFPEWKEGIIFGMKTSLEDMTKIVFKLKSSVTLGMPIDLGQVEVSIGAIKV